MNMNNSIKMHNVNVPDFARIVHAVLFCIKCYSVV